MQLYMHNWKRVPTLLNFCSLLKQIIRHHLDYYEVCIVYIPFMESEKLPKRLSCLYNRVSLHLSIILNCFLSVNSSMIYIL